MKKLISFAVTVCMVFCLIPTVTFANPVSDPDPADVVAAEPLEGEEAEAPATDETPVWQEEVEVNEGDDPPALDGWVQDGNNWYFYKNGAPLTGKQLIIIGSQVSGNWYYFNDQGIMQTGWQDLSDGYRYYFDPTPGTPGEGSMTGVMRTGWLKLGNVKYYLQTDGRMHTGWLTLNGAKYFFQNNGKMKTGWYKPGEKEWYYLNQNNGKAYTGWKTINNSKYYFNTDNCRMKIGWLNLNGDRYFLNNKVGKNLGKMKTGWYKPSKKKWYYLDTKTGKAKTGVCKINGLKYCFSAKGVMRTGIIKLSGDLYYFQVDGKQKGSAIGKGWFTASLDKKKRYSYGGGKLAVGTVLIGNYWYQFSTKNGAYIRTLGDKIDKRMQKQSSSTNYLLYVNCSSHQVRVYKGKKGNWSRIYTFTCTVGKSSSPTPKGTFYIGKRGTTHYYTNDKGDKVMYWYWLHFTNNSGMGFNSIIYYQDGKTVYDGNLGKNLSNGSIRLSLNNAKYLYNYVPNKTKVIIE